MNVVANIFTALACFGGEGKYEWDPSITHEGKKVVFKHIFIAQVLNVFAM